MFNDTVWRLRIIVFGSWFVGFFVVDLFVCLAGGAQARFEFLDEPEYQAPLLFSSVFADRAIEALSGQFAIFVTF
jgi:hypothetical protein